MSKKTPGIKPRKNRSFDRAPWRAGIFVPGRMDDDEFNAWQFFQDVYPYERDNVVFYTTDCILNMMAGPAPKEMNHG